ncbi:hypothetical protein K474DRAFT_1699794 [Panus rudis PR-1116 ss-1]|nr:hypothetical protein K474DRAFT_1699794 [Panus rudis PR-1116 ss-1]
MSTELLGRSVHSLEPQKKHVVLIWRHLERPRITQDVYDPQYRWKKEIVKKTDNWLYRPRVRTGFCQLFSTQYSVRGRLRVKHDHVVSRRATATTEVLKSLYTCEGIRDIFPSISCSREIDDMDNPQCGGSATVLTRLKSCEGLENNTISHSKTIIDILPHEIIGNIIDLVVTEHIEFMPIEDRIEREEEPFYLWLHSTHVCRRWRQIALQTPKIWRRILITSQDCINAMLERSRNTLLQVFAHDWESHQWKECADLICHVLSARPHRVETVELSISAKTKERIQSRMVNLRFPTLRRIRIHSEYCHNSDDNIISPPLPLHESALEDIDLRTWQFPLALLSLSTLTTHLKIEQPINCDAYIQFEELLDALHQMPNLQSLELKGSVESIDSIPNCHSTIHLPKLNSFALWAVDLFTATTLLQCLCLSTGTCNVELFLTGILTRNTEDEFAKTISNYFAHTPATILTIDLDFPGKNETIWFKAEAASNRMLTVSARSKVDIGGGRGMLSSLLSYLPTTEVHTLNLGDSAPNISNPSRIPDWWSAVNQQLRNVTALTIYSESYRGLIAALRPPASDSPLVDLDVPPPQPCFPNTPIQFPFQNLHHLEVSMSKVGEDVGRDLRDALIARRENGLAMPKTMSLYSDYDTSSYNSASVLMSDATYETLRELILSSEGTIKCNFCGPDRDPTQDWRTLR